MQIDEQGCVDIAPFVDVILDAANGQRSATHGDDRLIDRLVVGDLPDPQFFIAADAALVTMLRQVVYKRDESTL